LAAATPIYSAARTSACLKSTGAFVEPGAKAPITYTFSEIRQQIFWHASSRGDYKHWNDGESIMFTRNERDATHLVTRLVRVAYSFGATMAEARRSIGSRANAVWTSTSDKGVSAKRTALLTHCLR
jgi:hypothetical protein